MNQKVFMKKIKVFFSNMKDLSGQNREFGFFLIIMVFLICYSLYSRYQFSSDGVFTICRIDHYEPADGGGNLYIDIYYKGQVFRNVANSFSGSSKSKYRFVKIIKDQPTGVVIFLKDYPVPDCILIDSIPNDGWEKIPSCLDK